MRMPPQAVSTARAGFIAGGEKPTVGIVSRPRASKKGSRSSALLPVPRIAHAPYSGAERDRVADVKHHPFPAVEPPRDSLHRLGVIPILGDDRRRSIVVDRPRNEHQHQHQYEYRRRFCHGSAFGAERRRFCAIVTRIDVSGRAKAKKRDAVLCGDRLMIERLVQKRHHILSHVRRRVLEREPVSPAVEQDEPVRNAGGLEFGGELDRLRVGHGAIGGAVDDEKRRIAGAT